MYGAAGTAQTITGWTDATVVNTSWTDNVTTSPTIPRVWRNEANVQVVPELSALEIKRAGLLAASHRAVRRARMNARRKRPNAPTSHRRAHFAGRTAAQHARWRVMV
jgi:hypothetical protein